ncbi:MAG: nucleotidyltransferase domain-containing protein [Chloroflexota bacterium]|nr:MAG: nucleotidyltransferase domain-containing protein [Chloroflexota bacterium]
MFEQDRVLLRLQQRVLADPQILVCFLSGSYGRGTQDEYSDLDVALVFVDDGSRGQAFDKRKEFVRSVLPYVPAKSFDASHVRPYLHIALYSNGSKVDYRYETKESLTPNPWDREIRMLKDDDGWGEEFQQSCLRLAASPPLPTATAKDLASLDDRFWIMFMDVYRQVLRGDYDKPFTIYLQLLHFTLPELLRLLPAEEPARQALVSANYRRDAQVTIKHLRQLLQAYQAAREAIVRRHRLLFVPDETLERELQRKINP